jgi:hypothetical protein
MQSVEEADWVLLVEAENLRIAAKWGTESGGNCRRSLLPRQRYK